MKRVCANLALFAVTGLLAMLLCEAAARIALKPADYLSVEMVVDPILGAVPTPSMKSGFDGWGFRNPSVPASADIVAIGDSHTYGNTATMFDSWPAVLGRLTRSTVYNMGMGGYGPNQYLHILQTKALNLKPKVVLCGLYMGDDFENAFQITYGLDHWASLRKITPYKADFNIWQTAPEKPSWHKSARVWLSRHSVAYQVVFHGLLMGILQGEYQIRNAQTLYASAVSLNLPNKHILEAFLPKGILQRLDQEDPGVREGTRITFEILRQMAAICREHDIQFAVILIPTKEMVFAEYLEHNPQLRLGDVVDKLLVNERLAREATFQFLKDANIPSVDTLPALRRSIDRQLYARTAADMHPNKNGYGVIASAVSTFLNGRKLQQLRGMARFPMLALDPSRAGYCPWPVLPTTFWHKANVN